MLEKKRARDGTVRPRTIVTNGSRDPGTNRWLLAAHEL